MAKIDPIKAELERNFRIRERLARAITRILKRPANRGAVSMESIYVVEEDLRRIVRHAAKLGWLKMDPMEEENGISSNEKAQ